MKFNVITLMPEFVQNALSYGVVGSAFTKRICELNLVNPREFTHDNHQTVDDRPFGGGDGMLMMVAPLEKSLESLNLESYEDVYYLSPQGQKLTDKIATEMSSKKDVSLICGRYGGVDQRFLVKNKIKEISIGDYVLSGGELAAAVVIDAVVRKKSGVLGHDASAYEDSFSNEGLLEAPYFTRPREYMGYEAPETLLCGDPKKINEYRYCSSILVTLEKRPELLEDKKIDWKRVTVFLNGLNEKDLKANGFNKSELLKKIEEQQR